MYLATHPVTYVTNYCILFSRSTQDHYSQGTYIRNPSPPSSQLPWWEISFAKQKQWTYKNTEGKDFLTSLFIFFIFQVYCPGWSKLENRYTQPEFKGISTFVPGRALSKTASWGSASREHAYPSVIEGALQRFLSCSVCPHNAPFPAIITSSGKASNSQGRAAAGDAGVCYSTHTPLPPSLGAPLLPGD